MTSGYSEKPLIQKLGIKPEFRCLVLHPPRSYHQDLGVLPDGVQIDSVALGQYDFVHVFCTATENLATEFPRLKKHLKHAGMLWVSWPKGRGPVPADLSENVIRNIGLANGLVDVKVIAVDEVWSGLKFVYRIRDRK